MISIAQAGAEFYGGGLWLIGETVGASTAAIPAVVGSTLAVWSHGYVVLVSAASGLSGGGGNNIPSLKPINGNRAANTPATKHGYKDAHDFKEDFVGKDISKYDTKIGELFLENKSGNIQIPAGLQYIE